MRLKYSEGVFDELNRRRMARREDTIIVDKGVTSTETII